MINMLSGSIADFVKTSSMMKKASDNLYNTKDKKNSPFAKKDTQDVPSWLERMKEESEQAEDKAVLARITSKLDNGDDLTEKELEYLRRNNPEMYHKANALKQHKLFMKRRLMQCRDRDEVKSIGMSNAMSALSSCRASGSSGSSGAGFDKWVYAAANKEYKNFISSKEYAKLPEKERDEKKHLDTKA